MNSKGNNDIFLFILQMKQHHQITPVLGVQINRQLPVAALEL